MSLVSHVTPAAGGSRVDTQLTAYAEDIGSSKGTLACLALGTLEARLHDLTVTFERLIRRSLAIGTSSGCTLSTPS
jgi:hypothetical protein